MCPVVRVVIRQTQSHLTGVLGIMMSSRYCDIRQSMYKQEALREPKPPPCQVWRVWNSLLKLETVYPIPSSVHILKILWMFIHPLFREVANKHGPRKEKKEACVQGVKPITPKMFQIVPCVIANISWKYENPIIDFTVVSITDTTGAPRWETVKQSRLAWNSLANYLLCRAWRFIKISWKSVQPFP